VRRSRSCATSLSSTPDPYRCGEVETDAIARALELLAAAEDGESFVRTFSYTSGPAYGLLLDAASPGWPRRMGVSDEPAVLLMRALGV
jgi:hypothetical protein